AAPIRFRDHASPGPPTGRTGVGVRLAGMADQRRPGWRVATSPLYRSTGLFALGSEGHAPGLEHHFHFALGARHGARPGELCARTVELSVDGKVWVTGFFRARTQSARPRRGRGAFGYFVGGRFDCVTSAAVIASGDANEDQVQAADGGREAGGTRAL